MERKITAKRLLLIDDDEDDALFFSDALRDLKLPVILDHFDSGSEALNSLVQQTTSMPDLIFLDVNMPVVNGWECLRELKKIASLNDTPIVMYSTANLTKQGVNASDIGAAALFKKADSYDELKTGLGHLLTLILNL